MQAKDIADDFILKLLATQQGKWSSHFKGWGDGGLYTLGVPYNVPEKVLLAKMRSLHKRGLVGGCPCGCRGDWEITDKGLAKIGVERTTPYNGY